MSLLCCGAIQVALGCPGLTAQLTVKQNLSSTIQSEMSDKFQKEGISKVLSYLNLASYSRNGISPKLLVTLSVPQVVSYEGSRPNQSMTLS